MREGTARQGNSAPSRVARQSRVCCTVQPPSPLPRRPLKHASARDVLIRINRVRAVMRPIAAMRVNGREGKDSPIAVAKKQPVAGNLRSSSFILQTPAHYLPVGVIGGPVVWGQQLFQTAFEIIFVPKNTLQRRRIRKRMCQQIACAELPWSGHDQFPSRHPLAS